jgi:PAS domain S-box-containing protein
VKDERKTKKQLLEELRELRQQVSEVAEKSIMKSRQGIKEKKQTRELLRESEESFRALTENSQDVIMRFDRDFRHLYVNSYVEKMTGISAKKFIGKTHKELGFPLDLCEFWESAIEKVFKTGKINRVEFELPSKIWIDWLLMPEFSEDGSVHYVITSARDITERKHLENELKNYHQQLQKLVDERTVDLQNEISLRKKAEVSLRKSEKILKERVRELEEFYNMAVERELRMIELKKQIESLRKEQEELRKQ